jgi:CheY-like chemotaxis protein
MARVFPPYHHRVPRGLKVLVVEDDDLVRMAHRDILTLLGVETHAVKNGKEALDLIGTVERKFDLILMARIMPVMDGITVGTLHNYIHTYTVIFHPMN